MRSSAFRALGVIGFGLAPAILFAGCGADEGGARTTLNSIQPSSYVVRPAVTTTTTDPEAESAGLEVDDENRAIGSQEYEVQSGDAVSVIARRFGISMEDLASFNEWPNGINQAIFPGDVIRIPPGALVPGAASADDGAAPTTSGDGDGTTASPGTAPETTLAGAGGECVEGEHEIVQGDFPGRVAGLYDITVEQLEAANAGNPAYASFPIGGMLRIPCDDAED